MHRSAKAIDQRIRDLGGWRGDTLARMRALILEAVPDVVEEWMEEEGRTPVRDRYVVSAPLPGRMRRIELEPGDAVVAGKSVLAGFEPSDPALLDVLEPSGFTKISARGIEEQRVNVIVDFDEPREKWQSIGDGYRVELRIIVWQKDDVLKVPTSSLFRHDGKWAVYKVDNGVAVRPLVEIGQRSGLEAEVLSGVDAGQRIIVYPSDSIADGIKVQARTQARASL